MASPFLGIAAGLTQGLAQGAQTGISLMAQRQQMAIQQQQASAASLTALQNATKIPDPAMRTLAFQKLLPGIGIDPKSDTGKQWIAAMGKATDESLKAAGDLFAAAGINGLDARTVGTIMADHPEMLVNLAAQVSQRKAMASILAGIPNPDGTYNTPQVQPTGTGDMGTGTQGAGGTVAAPTVGAGTSTDGTTPAIVPPAPSSTAPAIPVAPVAPVSTPVVTAPAVTTQPAPVTTAPATTAPATTAQPAATQSAPAPTTTELKPTSVAKGPDGQDINWDPYTSTYVQGINKAIDNFLVAPGDNTEVINLLKDRRNQYIEDKKLQYSHSMDALNLALKNKEIGIAGYRASLEAQGLKLSQEKFGYQKEHDQKLFEYGKYKDGIEQAVAERRITVDEANQKLNQKRYELDLRKEDTDPRSPPGQIQWDISHGLIPGQSGTTEQPTGPTTSVPIPPPRYLAGRNPEDLGKKNPDGTITMTDIALQRSVGLANEADRIVYDPRTKQWSIQVATATTATTKEGLQAAQDAADNTQVGMNAADAVMSIAEKDASAVGYMGRYKGGLQTFASLGRDILKTLPITKPVLDRLGLDKIPYDPNVPTTAGLSEVLNAAVAKALTGSGAGLGAYTTGVKSTEELTDLTKGSSEDIKYRMGIVKKILSDAHNLAISHLPTGGKSSVEPGPTVEVQPDVTTPKETPLQSQYDRWQRLSPEERKPLLNTKDDMTPSRFKVTDDGDSHLSAIPNGQILLLQQQMTKYKGDLNKQAQIKAFFNLHFGKTAAAQVGYP